MNTNSLDTVWIVRQISRNEVHAHTCFIRTNWKNYLKYFSQVKFPAIWQASVHSGQPSCMLPCALLLVVMLKLGLGVPTVHLFFTNWHHFPFASVYYHQGTTVYYPKILQGLLWNCVQVKVQCMSCSGVHKGHQGFKWILLQWCENHICLYINVTVGPIL